MTCQITGTEMKEKELPGALPNLDQLKDYEVALEFYANSKDWAQFISSEGGLFDEQDGDPVMAFRNGDDCPWETARAALEKYKPKEMK